MDFQTFKDQHIHDFEKFMYERINDASKTQLEESMNYSLTAGGKRLRPLLLLATLDFFNHEVKEGYHAAAALEMIHTYSLIHDDLPALDNDDLRRGLATNHIEFGEATAILAGDGLLTKAFEVIAAASIAPKKTVQLIHLLASSAGHEGMIGGQQADINGENSDLEVEDLKSIHARKTGELLRFALVGAGIIANQDQIVLDHLEDMGLELGIAYQIRDDILDVVGDQEDLGKLVGSDEKLGKSTYPALLGLDQAYLELDASLNRVRASINKIAQAQNLEKAQVLLSFVDYLNLGRENG